jgi:hypothetical protein
LALAGREVIGVAQEKEKVEEVSFKGACAEYLKVKRDLASEIFINLKHDIEHLIINIYADTDEKNTAFFLLGRLVEAFDQLDASLRIAEEVADYYNEDIRNAIVVSIEVLLQAYADLRAGRPLSEVNDHLRDYVIRLHKTLTELITEIAKRTKCT